MTKKKRKTYFLALLTAGLLALFAAAPAFAAEEGTAEMVAESTEAEPAVSRTVTVGESKKAAEAAEKTESPEEAEPEDASAESSADTGLVSLGIFKTTAYCPCYACSEGYGRHTCTGAVAQANHTIAVDPRVIPYGSRVLIDGIVYTAEDRGGGVKGNHIDIFYDTHAQTRQYGSRRTEVFLLT